jgi:hypothetical protein
VSLPLLQVDIRRSRRSEQKVHEVDAELGNGLERRLLVDLHCQVCYSAAALLPMASLIKSAGLTSS